MRERRSRHISLGPGVGLHIDIPDRKEGLGPLYGKPLHLLHKGTSSVVAMGDTPLHICWSEAIRLPPVLLH